MPTARIIISDDGILDAYPIERHLPSFLSRDVFNNTVRNKKPVIIDGAALRWLGMSEEGATPEFDMEILEECDVEMLIAFDGRNFLRNTLCSTKSVNLKTGMRSILGRYSGDFLTGCLQERAYIRIYFDCHRRLLEKVDLSYLTRLASFTSLVDVISEFDDEQQLSKNETPKKNIWTLAQKTLKNLNVIGIKKVDGNEKNENNKTAYALTLGGISITHKSGL